MLARRLADTWVGHYRFTEYDGAAALPDRPVPFSMTLKSRGLVGIRGTFQEDVRLGIPEQAEVRGRIRFGGVVFTKMIPQLYFVQPDGRVQPFDEWYKEQYGQEFPYVVPHPPIEYEGRLVNRGRELAGRWQIAASTLETDSGDWRLDMPRVAGTWKARRVSETSPARGDDPPIW